MKRISRWIIGDERNRPQRDMLWNMIGSGIYALASMMLGAAVTRILGADQGGIFFFAFSTLGQQMFIVSYFGVRPIQITDMAGRYSFGDYRRLRLFTSGAAMAAGILYALLFAQPALKQWVIITMVCYKVIDGYADVYESEFQRSGKLYLTGVSNTVRTILSVSVFLVVLMTSRDLRLACIMAVAAQLLGFGLMNVSIIKQLQGIDRQCYKGHFKNLLKESQWLFLSAFLDLYIFASSKYAIDAHLPPSASTYFGTIFIPTSVINLAAGFVIRPFLTALSEQWDNQQYQRFWKTINRIALAIAGFTLMGMLAGYYLGIPVLSFLLGQEAGMELWAYRTALVINITGGGFYAVLNLLYYVLVIMKDQKSIFIVYGMGSALAFLIAPFFVKQYGITGGSLSYLLLMVLLAGFFQIIVWRKYKQIGGGKNYEG